MKNHIIKQIKEHHHKIFFLFVRIAMLKPTHKKYDNFIFEEWDEDANFYK